MAVAVVTDIEIVVRGDTCGKHAYLPKRLASKAEVFFPENKLACQALLIGNEEVTPIAFVPSLSEYPTFFQVLLQHISMTPHTARWE